jgi:hypothetical protein
MTVAMPAVKPVGDRVRDELDEAAETRQPHDEQDDAGHHAGDQQPGQAVFGHDGREDDDEGGGRSRHLHLRAAEQGDERAGDDGGVDAVLRRHADGDGQRHGQRQGDDADDDAGDQVGGEVAPTVAAAQRLAQRQARLRPELGDEGDGGLVAAPHVRQRAGRAGDPSS